MDSISGPLSLLLEELEDDIASDIQTAEAQCAQITSELCDLEGMYALIAVERLHDRSSLVSGRLLMTQFLLEQRVFTLLDRQLPATERAVVGEHFHELVQRLGRVLETVRSTKELAGMMQRLLEHEANL